MRERYPPIEPYRTGFLNVSPLHILYWEESGNPHGAPIVFLHGGPGSGTEPSHRCFFDPAHYRIILFDQRGCGKSTPFASLEENTTWDLVADMEKLRKHLQADRWIVFGGSWGSTLALAYAETHPDRVKGLIVRGIFLCRPEELAWFYQKGASWMFADAWENFMAPIPASERHDMISAYYKRLAASDLKAAKAWAGWEGATLRLRFDPELYKNFTADAKAMSIARIECHYFVHQAFFKTPNWLLEHASALRSIPGVIVHGRYDVICPFKSAWDLHKAWPEAKLEIIPDAGHAAGEPGITDALVRATDSFRLQ